MIKQIIYDILLPVIIPVRRVCNSLPYRKREKHFSEVVQEIRQRGKKIRFGAYVMYDSDYSFDSVFRKMLENDSLWDPKVIVIPDVLRGKKNSREVYLRTKQFLIDLYGEDMVLDGWDLNDNYYDHLDDLDVVYYNNPYDYMAHKYHSIQYAAEKKILPVYVTYGYEVSSTFTQIRLCSKEINSLWRCYTDTVYSYNDYCRYEAVKGKNVKLVGYAKMDNLAPVLSKPQVNKRKTILITPHHTVKNKKLPLSNFLRYNDLFLRLPEMFPDIDFIFRPHPFLFVTLINEKIWTEKQVNDYIDELSKRGIYYSVGGYYFDVFAKADAIINDSGSFSVEWLFTGKPGCFMWNPKLKKSQMTTLMQKAVSEYSIAYNEDDIISFVKTINSECAAGTCEMKEWVKKNIAVNYPNVAQAIITDLTDELFVKE